MRTMLRNLLMIVWTDGGQGTARRNAWAAMAADAKRARQRSEAATSLRAVAGAEETAVAVAVSHG